MTAEAMGFFERSPIHPPQAVIYCEERSNAPQEYFLAPRRAGQSPGEKLSPSGTIESIDVNFSRPTYILN
jgi:hypothetical protein